MTKNGQPRRRRLRFILGLEPGPSVERSERSYEELCEAYVAQRRARAASTSGGGASPDRRDSGDGNQAATPVPPHDEQAPPRRRKPGAR